MTKRLRRNHTAVFKVKVAWTAMADGRSTSLPNISGKSSNMKRQEMVKLASL